MRDLVNCERLAEDGAVLERDYALDELPRLHPALATPKGGLRARFVFAKLAPGRWGADVAVDATPVLTCQRCMQPFALTVRGGSAVEFADSEDAAAADAQRELFRMENGLVSLRELAEEELLMALPIAPVCGTPQTCGGAPAHATGEAAPRGGEDMRRPFGALEDLLKKTR